MCMKYICNSLSFFYVDLQSTNIDFNNFKLIPNINVIVLNWRTCIRGLCYRCHCSRRCWRCRCSRCWGRSYNVICFDFVSQLLSLLQDTQKMQQKNLLIDINNPCEMYISPDSLLSDALSGDAYCEVYHHAYQNHNGTNPLIAVSIWHGKIAQALIKLVDLNWNHGVFVL